MTSLLNESLGRFNFFFFITKGFGLNNGLSRTNGGSIAACFTGGLKLGYFGTKAAVQAGLQTSTKTGKVTGKSW